MYKIKGKILFEPEHISKKHQKQGNWKRVAMVNIPGQIHDYYRWFVERRFTTKLVKPVRGAHVTFINDKLPMDNPHYKTYSEELKQFDGKTVELTVDPMLFRTDGTRWWIKIHCEELLDIREALGFKRYPHYGLHLTVGNVNPKYAEHMEYVHNLIKKGFIK